MRTAVYFAPEETHIGPALVIVEHVVAMCSPISLSETEIYMTGNAPIRIRLPQSEVMMRLGFNNGGG